LRFHRSSRTPLIGRIVFAILGLLSLIFLGITSARAQEITRPVAQVAPERRALDPLIGDEQALAERIARTDPRVKELLGEAGVRLVSATPVLIKTDAPEKTNVALRQIEVVLFRPQGEVGARVVVDLHQRGVVAVNRLAGDQVPYTNDDLLDAFQLALRDPEVLQALGPAAQSFRIRPTSPAPPGLATPENTVGGLPVRSPDPNDPCSTHRCLRLTFRRGTDYLSHPIVTVDLTAKHVYVEKRNTDGKAAH
jgi:hypothetical protein